MWEEGYDDAWASIVPVHPENEEYMGGYSEAEEDMDACEEEPAEDSD